MQASGGRLKQPEVVHPYDETRLSASIEYGASWRDRPVAAMLGWGQKREPFGVFDAYLLEAHLAIRPRDAIYVRTELTTKAILGGGIHTPGATHFHPHSRIGALTGGYVRDLIVTARGRIGAGGDVTVYRVPNNLSENYGQPVSFHVFLRYASGGQAAAAHHRVATAATPSAAK